MRDADLPQLLEWLKTPAVAEWWRDEAAMTLEQLMEKMAPRIARKESVSPFFFSIDGEDAGYVQCYRVADDPEASRLYEDDEVANSVGVDMLIGNERWLHRGFGGRVLTEFVEQHVFSDPEISACMIDPETTNVIATRAYEKAGFRYVREFVSPHDNRKYTLMRLERS